MAAQTSLEAQLRQTAGKGSARQTRREGMIPGVVYGKHLEKPLQIAVNPKAVKQAINTPKRMNTVIGMTLGGKAHMVILKEYQQDPISRELLHADFIDVRENEKVKVKVPVILTGKSIGVADGGILSQTKREIEVFALPAAIPEKIEVDISHLKITDVLHINDVKLPEGVTVKTLVNYTIAIIAIPDTEVVAPVAAAAATTPDGKPVDPKAAAAAPADGKAGDAKAGAAAPAKADAKKK